MIGDLTSYLGLTKPNFEGSADIRVVNADLDVIDAAVNRNLLVNPGFEVWQRGVGPFATTATYGPDRWQLSTGAGSSQSVSRDASLPDAGSAYCAAVAYTHVTGASVLQQRIEDYPQLRGRTLVFAARVRASVANAVRVGIHDGTGWSYGAYHAGGGGYETLSMALAVPASAASITVGVWYNATGTFYLDNATLHLGVSPVPYAPLPPAEEWARCLRYYEVHGGATGTFPIMQGYNAAGATSAMGIGFAVRKAVTPTLTKNGTWTATNCGQPTASNPTPAGYDFNVTVTALGAFSSYPADATCTIVAEANP